VKSKSESARSPARANAPGKPTTRKDTRKPQADKSISAVYGTSTVKRLRRTQSQIGQLDDALVSIVQEQKPMTVRQVFYQGTVRRLVPKEEGQGYRVIQRRLVELRESGRVPYSWITDNIRFVHGYTRYGGVEDFAQEVSSLYRRDYWRDAAVRVEIWIEKDALASVIAPVVIHEWGLQLHVARGFSSISYLHQAADTLVNDGRPAFIYTLTDLDPSGVGIARDIESKLKAMVKARAELHVERLAVEPWQVEDWSLPTRPTKHTDTRAAKFVEQFGDASVELDAIPPNTLRQIVGDAIARHADAETIARLKRTEALERETIAHWQTASGGKT
jgi:hypothetical protein